MSESSLRESAERLWQILCNAEPIPLDNHIDCPCKADESVVKIHSNPPDDLQRGVWFLTAAECWEEKEPKQETWRDRPPLL